MPCERLDTGGFSPRGLVQDLARLHARKTNLLQPPRAIHRRHARERHERGIGELHDSANLALGHHHMSALRVGG